MTSNSKAEERFGKQDFRCVADDDVYICPAGETLPYRYTTEENGLILRRYWTNACQDCPIQRACTTSKERRVFFIPLEQEYGWSRGSIEADMARAVGMPEFDPVGPLSGVYRRGDWRAR